MNRFLTNKWYHVGILLVLLAAAVYYSQSEHDLRKRMQYATFDSYNKILPRPASDRVAIVDLDEESIKHLGQWPWPRNIMAQMVTTLKGLGASVIAFDVVFAEPDRTSPLKVVQSLPEGSSYDFVRQALSSLPDSDATFATAIQSAGNVVMGFTRAPAEETLSAPHLASTPLLRLKDTGTFYRDTFLAPGVAESLSQFTKVAAGNGSFMATPDIDGIIRQVSLLIRYKKGEEEAKLYPMLGLEALRVALDPGRSIMINDTKDDGPFSTSYQMRVSELQIPVESDAKFWVYYRHIKPQEYISAARLFDPAQLNALRERIEGKIVFIGTSTEGLRDIRSTPLDIFVPGVEVHVNMVEQILQGKFLTRPDLVVGAEAIIIGLSGLLIILLAPFMNVIILGVMTTGLMGGMFLGSWLSFKNFGLLLDPVYPSIALSFLFLASSLLSYLRSDYERRQVRQAFGYYISPNYMEELTKNPDRLKLGGEVRDLTVMFTDIRSFTSISENLTPEELIQLMNDFLTPMSDLVMDNRGTIDKYMGDAMMAFWNAPLDDPDHERHACMTALKMDRALGPVNQRLQEKAMAEGRAPFLLNAGIGINTGPCSVGNMGSKQRFAYSALGDAVNLASRLESQTKIYGVNILVGEETRRKVPELAMLELDLIQVKGKIKPVRIYTLLGDDAMAGTEAFTRWEEAHLAMLASYRAMEWDDAFQKILLARKAAKDRLSVFYDLYAGRIVDYMKIPPKDNWGGVHVAKDK